MCILDNGKTTKLKVKELIIIQMVKLYMKVHGKMIFRKGRVERPGVTEQYLRVIIYVVRKLEPVSFFGLTKELMRDKSWRIT